MRHEQSCAYAADGWARTTATPGVCSVTAGCGLTNAVTGLCAAGLAGSAVVCIAGQHPTTEDGLGSFQEAYGSEVCRSFTKFAKRVLDGRRSKSICGKRFATRQVLPRASRSSRSRQTFSTRPDLRAISAAARRSIRRASFARARIRRSVAQAIDLLLAARRPLIAAGDGIFARAQRPSCSNSSSSRTSPFIPGAPGKARWRRTIRSPSEVHGRSRSQGAPTWCWRSAFGSGAARSSAREPTWNESARYIQADTTPTRIGLHVPSEVAVVGDAKLILRQPCDAARASDWKRPGRSDWLKEIAKVRANFDQAIAEQERGRDDDMPIHPARIARELRETIDPGRNDRHRQLHDERLDFAIFPRALPRPDPRRRPACARRPRRRHGNWCSARPTGKAGRARHRRRRSRRQRV